MISCEKDEYFIEELVNTESEDEYVIDGRIGIKISKYMNQSSAGYVQGADCYGDYLFQIFNANAAVNIYNLRKKVFIGSVELTSKSSNHCNNVSFSRIFFKENDEFPLLYVSGSGSGTYNHVQVYRITRNAFSFSLEQVQEIVFPKSSPHNHLYWTDVMMDSEYMYVSSAAHGGGGRITIFHIPSLEDGEVILNDDDIVDSFEVDKFTHHQGATIFERMLYIFDGVPQWGDTNYLRIIDLEKKVDFAKINITEKGLKAEPEGAFVYNGRLFCATNNSGILSIDLIYER